MTWKWSFFILNIWNKYFFNNCWIYIRQVPDKHLFIITPFSRPSAQTFVRNRIFEGLCLKFRNLRKLVSLINGIILYLFKLFILKRLHNIINLWQTINQQYLFIHFILISLKILKNSLETTIYFNIIFFVIKHIFY